ncbi:hypothetical protein R3X27_18070 [Tropicimonas sp. TH_r6]|uniref:hypothetical protein n=1 Tax=Tropicimonas sp. TH_r6 TaxID=3082085 RepID=UPI0029545049|nr:hypothetical protein [Tropicimonas sp. TH_r6]MDV7144589.1 hypothetical protein [Tropicimonas sp. TH_r6]
MTSGRILLFLTLPLAAILLSAPDRAAAEPSPLFAEGPLFQQNEALLTISQPAPNQGARPNGASLFVGRDGRSLFAPVHPSSAPSSTWGKRQRIVLGLVPNATAQTHRILHLIAQAEAGQMGYDAVQHGAKILPARRPTALSLAEVFQWIEDTPGQQHAIGRYQFIPKTLQRLVSDLGIDRRSIFTPQLQDRLANRLLEEAGLSRLAAGEMTRHQYMNNLAKIWAGLPTSSGKSHYHGYAGNRATMSWASFDAEMARIFPG